MPDERIPARAAATGRRPRRRAKGRALLGVVMALAGCAHRPEFVDGRRVIGTRWVNGKPVYVLGDSDADRERMQKKAEEADKAAKGVVFGPAP